MSGWLLSEIGVCVECPKNGDDTVKTVSPCPICKRFVCSIHSQPMLAYIPDFKHTGKVIKEAKEIIKSHNAGGLGHPCLPYTLNFWKEFDLEKERRKQRIKNQMDGFGYVTDEEIEHTSERSLEEIRRKLEERKQQDIIASQESKKTKKGFWERFKTNM